MKNELTNSLAKNQRTFRIVNFFAFNLLFFALYLNFIHQDANAPGIRTTEVNYKQATILAENPEQYLNKANIQHPSSQQNIAVNENTDAINSSLN